MLRKTLSMVLLLFFFSSNLVFASSSSYEKERSIYLKALKEIVYESTHSGIKPDVRLDDAKTPEEKAAKLDKLKRDALKAANILDENRAKLARLDLHNPKLITINEKIISSFDQSSDAMRGIAKDVEGYNVIDFFKNLLTLKRNESILKEALKEINAEYLLN